MTRAIGRNAAALLLGGVLSAPAAWSEPAEVGDLAARADARAKAGAQYTREALSLLTRMSDFLGRLKSLSFEPGFPT